MRITCHTLPAVSWVAAPVAAYPVPVAVFRVPVAENGPHLEVAGALLEPAEQQRAMRYRRPADGQRFVVARAALRLLLGAYLGRSPAGLRFGVGPQQKPVLLSAPGLHYNVSHAGNWVLIAIARQALGVDLERVDPAFPIREVLAASFSPAEQAFVRENPVDNLAFYQVWTRKEALVKATARGIDEEFAQVPGLDGAHHRPAGSFPHSTVPEWAVATFTPVAGYVAALAYPAEVLAASIRFYDLGSSLFDPLGPAAGRG